MTCNADQNVCRDATLDCGTNDCTATCNATMLPPMGAVRRRWVHVHHVLTKVCPWGRNL